MITKSIMNSLLIITAFTLIGIVSIKLEDYLATPITFLGEHHQHVSI